MVAKLGHASYITDIPALNKRFKDVSKQRLYKIMHVITDSSFT